MRISYWSSDVCSSDLYDEARPYPDGKWMTVAISSEDDRQEVMELMSTKRPPLASREKIRDRKSVAQGKSVSVRVALGGCRIIQKKHKLMLVKSSNVRIQINRCMTTYKPIRHMT